MILPLFFANFFYFEVNSHRECLLDRVHLLERGIQYNFNGVEGVFIR